MSLTRDVSRFFDPEIRSRGLSYARTGRVRLNQAGPNAVTATVKGSTTWRGPTYYKVRAVRLGEELGISCECPFFGSNGNCKHLWAVLFFAERSGHLAGDGHEPPVRRLHRGGQGHELPRRFLDALAVTETSSGGSAEWPPSLSVVPGGGAGTAPAPESWRRRLGALQRQARDASQNGAALWPPNREIIYQVDGPETARDQNVILRILARDARRKSDAPDPMEREEGSHRSESPRPARIRRVAIPGVPDPDDRHILGLLSGVEDHEDPIWTSHGSFDAHADEIPNRFRLRAPFSAMILPLLCRTGRCVIELPDEPELRPLEWDEGGPWELRAEVSSSPDGSRYELRGAIVRGNERLDRQSVVMTTTDGLLFTRGRVLSLLNPAWSPWLTIALSSRPIEVPENARDDFLTELLQTPNLPVLDLPGEMTFEEVAAEPSPHLKIRPIEDDDLARNRYEGDLSFDYAGTRVGNDDPRRAVFDPSSRKLVLRNGQLEAAARLTLLDAGFRQRPARYAGERERLTVPQGRLLKAVRRLINSGWHVEAQGKVYRRAGRLRMEVAGSGIDWFELRGSIDFGGETVPFPKLLAALRHGDGFVVLSDGSLGMIPEEWANRYAFLAGLGEDKKEHVRFRASQVGLIDALLSSQDDVVVDEPFERARGRLRNFSGVGPVEPGPGFSGELRPYQKEGLGWLLFLKDFGFGGCLADDMGLGKTVMVLALLETRAALRRARRAGDPGNGEVADIPPALVVVPKSLVFNWINEAARFTPGLRVLDHTGGERLDTGTHFDEYDMILTTYGTLRRDALLFHDRHFDYVILDEAQAIKNASTASAKAARLIRADHRLALSGTPVENHLGELWSLFEFLNPGMLGRSTVLKLAAGNRRPDPEGLSLLAQGLKPFILRRTKEQVARELPEKLEQTITCELEPVQKELYDELRAHYRASILGAVERQGLERSKMLVLEALLRLRQAACHPGLIDRTRVAESSAKLDVLLPQIEQVIEEGHKALVFSQFTSFLSIVRERIEQLKLPYEYLDGKTRNREERVLRFQTDPECRLFLISLKAGGLGLNLTAAEYVYLLDPWWNPAVEAQAIDRAHRIGQERRVFACRIIAKDTVEEKVVELQMKKKSLAEAIVSADESLLRKLTRKDLEMLLG